MYKSFRDMEIWQLALEVAEKTFNLTEHLPKKEDYGLTSQIRRSALSISANIAEAFGRHHINDKIKFYYYSRGSITETQSHLEYGKRVGYFEKEIVENLDQDLSSLTLSLNKLIKSLKS
ncbi:MAG: four helix bundle protein [Melioribacteraceae bacterium]|nr:four helix bundle protein [Melioribacteraceae bacterium]